MPLNLCTKPRRPLGIWSPASLCEQELKEEDEQPHLTPGSRLQQQQGQQGEGRCRSSSWDSDPHPAARPPAPTTATTSERTFQVGLKSHAPSTFFVVFFSICCLPSHYFHASFAPSSRIKWRTPFLRVFQYTYLTALHERLPNVAAEFLVLLLRIKEFQG